MPPPPPKKKKKKKTPKFAKFEFFTLNLTLCYWAKIKTRQNSKHLQITVYLWLKSSVFF